MTRRVEWSFSSVDIDPDCSVRVDCQIVDNNFRPHIPNRARYVLEDNAGMSRHGGVKKPTRANFEVDDGSAGTVAEAF